MTNKNTSEKIIIAIDGPSGVGKSTVSRIVASSLGLLYVDTGAMYRSVALATIKNSLDIENKDKISELCKSLTIKFEATPEGQLVLLNSKDVTKEIRTKEISELSSKVSQIKGVREFTKSLQRSLGSAGGVVMEGRDIGTVIFPDAEVKIFLTASNKVRAERRLEDYEDGTTNIDSVIKELEERDSRDKERDIAPLKQAPDAHLIDTGGMKVEEVVENILKIADNVLVSNK